MIVKLIWCPSCNKQHGDNYRCPDAEGGAFKVETEDGDYRAEATTLDGARCAVETLQRDSLGSGEYPERLVIVAPDGMELETGEANWNQDGDVWVVWATSDAVRKYEAA